MKLYKVIGEMVMKNFLGVVLFYSSLVPKVLLKSRALYAAIKPEKSSKKYPFRSTATEEIG